MRRLVVMRHAKAEAVAASDHARRLVERGRQDAAEAGRWARAEGVLPDHAFVSTALECDRERTGACPTPHGRALRIESGRCPAVHVFFDGSDLRFWSGAPRPGSSSASIPAGPFAP